MVRIILKVMETRDKLVIVCLGMIGVIALTLGFFQFKENLKGPFYGLEPIGTEEAERRLASLSNTNSEIDYSALKTKDTDNDHLSDYEEMYVYHTSPYLPDSDSDGFADKIEIESGNSPTCPAGKVCGKETLKAEGSTTNINSENFLGTSFELGNVPADTLRQYLKEAGATDEMLASIDDATLMQLYEQALSGQSGSNPLAGMDLSSSLADLPASEIRELLLAKGIPSEWLQSIDDETLKQLFLEAGQGQ